MITIIFHPFYYSYMNTPQRLSALRTARRTLRVRDQKIARMKQWLESVMLAKGVEVDPEASEEIEKVIKENSFEIDALPKSDFRRVFWDQQVRKSSCFAGIICIIHNIGDCYENEEQKRNTLASTVHTLVSQLVSHVSISI